MKPIYSLSIIASLAMLLSACHGHGHAPAPAIIDEQIPVTLVPVGTQAKQQPIQASGQFTTEDETMLSFKTGGVVDRILVKEGDRVRKGRLLATIHLTEINAQVRQADLTYQKAERDHARWASLFRDSVGTLEQVQNAQTTLSIARQQLGAARFNRAYAEIRAVSDGYVLKKLVGEGQMIGPGEPVLQINGARQTGWRLKVAVSDKEWSEIEMGAVAEIETDALAGQILKGTVLRKSKGTDAATGTFAVTISVQDGRSEALAAGLFGKAKIYAGGKSSTSTIPYDAVLDGDGADAYVFTTRDNRTAQKRKVKVGNIVHGTVTVIQGLETETAVIVAGNAYLKDGATIKVIK
ncbi:MAG: efflux RND transporter periplasmic adaptor subunit [Sphingobacteriales bacterium]|nr:MAG: efflux RND transporter periplasmic adaptor subunit [Sphingobacteriales bacterium]